MTDPNHRPPTNGAIIALLLVVLLAAAGSAACGTDPAGEPAPPAPGLADAVPPGTARGPAPPGRAAGAPPPVNRARPKVVAGLEQDSDLAAMFLQAAELARAGLYDRALDLYRKILEQRPDHVPTLVNAARAHFNRGRTEEAITLLEEANRILPGHPRTLGYLGMAEAKAGRFEDAVIHLEGSQLIDPTRVDVGNELAGAYYELKRYDEAEEAWQRVLKLDPDNLLARSGLEQVRQLRQQAAAAPPAK